MRVLHVIPSLSERSGGPGQAIVPMCRALQDRGIEVLIVATDHDLASPHSEVFRKGISARLFPNQWGNSFKYSRPLVHWLNRNVESFDLVHIHAVFNHSSIAAARASYLRGVPYIVRPLGTLDPWSMSQKAWRKTIFWKIFGRRMLGDAAAIHYTAQAEKDATENSLKLNHNRGRVVPLGVDLRVKNSAELDDYLATKFPQLIAAHYILVLSRLVPTKGLDILLEAFEAIVRCAGFHGWRLVFAGDGPREYVSALKKKAAAYNLFDSVVFTGWVENMDKQVLLRNASLLALVSAHENFGLSVMESLAYGVPVVVSPEVSLSHEIESVGAGWISTADIDALTVVLSAAMRSKDERLKRGEAGRKLAQKFSWSVVACDLEELYDSVLADRRSGTMC